MLDYVPPAGEVPAGVEITHRPQAGQQRIPESKGNQRHMDMPSLDPIQGIHLYLRGIKNRPRQGKDHRHNTTPPSGPCAGADMDSKGGVKVF